MSMNEVLFCGFNELPASAQQELVTHVMVRALHNALT